jgi:hypothetical protein
MMSDRGFLFLFSVFMVLAGLGAAAWLLATGQAGSVDGLFLMLTSLAAALVFAMYLSFLIRRAMAEAQAPDTAKARAADSAAAKQEPAPAAR